MEFLDANLEVYVEACTDPEPELLKELKAVTEERDPQSRMLTGHYVGRTLAFFSQLIQPKTIVEVGTFTGYGALCLAEGLAKDGHLHTLENDPERIELARQYFDKAGLSDRITIHEGDAVETLNKIDLPPIDLAFIDGQKTQYLDYYEAIVMNMPSGGLILTDNVLWSGRVLDKSFDDNATVALREFNTFVQGDSRVDKILLPLRDGIYAIRKR